MSNVWILMEDDYAVNIDMHFSRLNHIVRWFSDVAASSV